MSKKLSRRDLILASTGIAGLMSFNPLQIMMKSILDGIVSKSNASELGINPRNYIFIFLKGGPQRWVWDPIMAYDDSSKIVANPSVITKFTSSNDRFLTGEYSTTNINGVNMPWMWQFDIPTSDGATAPMSKLMDSMMVMMGIDVNNPAHTGAATQQFFPLGIPYNLGSYPSDLSNRPLPYISINGYPDMFKSKAGNTSISARVNNRVLNNLLNPFITPVNALEFSATKNNVEQEIRLAIKKISENTKEMHPASSSFLKNRNSAEELILSKFDNLEQTYVELYNKYNSLIERATDPTGMILTGINDKMVGENMNIINKIQGSKIAYLAGQFAVTEFLITNNLTSSITFNAYKLGSYRFDSHSTPFLEDTISTTYWNRAMASCLYELISVFKGKNVYDNTVIQINGEFNRNPRTTGLGSDHGYKNSSTTFLSGAIPKFHAIGNTLLNAPSSKYKGTYGYKAHNPGFGTLNLGHVAASVSTLLKIPSPIRATPTLLKEVDGKIVSKLPPTKIS